MTARRITGRAAAMATITVLFAGAAAAAAGGVLPSPFADGPVDTISAGSEPDVTGTDPATSGPDTSGPDITDPATSDVPGTDGATTTLPEAYGLCTAWRAGHEKKADNPAFSKLQHAADEHGGTVEEFCDQVFADKDASRGDDDATDDDDDADDTDTSDEPSPDSGPTEQAHGSGNGNGHGSDHGHGAHG